ncbi:MAG: effector-associated domain EAD1-containing protein [Caldilineaceae bacterium]
MDSQTVFARLRDALAHLYPTTESARRIADDAGLDAHQVRFSAQALENWHAILGEAVRVDKVNALLHIVLTEYGSNAEMSAAYGMYRHFIEQGGRIAPPEPIYGDQGDSPTSGVQIGTGAKNVNIGQNITQTTIEGNVDTSGGDVVGRDKVTIGTIINNLFRGDSEEVRKLRNRQAMLNLVYDIWVKGVLEHSLYNQLLIDLDMEQRPEAVERPWGMVLETPAQDSRLLPAGTKIATVFAELNQSMLILGEPGSGKSTMLLELARDLLAQAAQNSTLPIPVLFNLSSWANKRSPIRQWLVDELREKYQIPKTLA